MTVGVILVVVAGFVAAAIGSAARFGLSEVLNRDFPIGTLAINLTASALLGLIATVDGPVRVIVGVAALGAFSTWSTAANEVAALSRKGQGALAIGYLCLLVTSGVLAAWFGLRLGSALL